MTWTRTAALFLALAVTLGAFGAHALKDRFTPYEIAIWEKAVLYHFLHALGLLALGPRVGHAGWLFVAGIVLFSGSLYALALTGNRTLGAVTPLGGLCFIAAWLWIAFRKS